MKTERMLGTNERVPTMIFNGYRDQVEGLYANLGITDPRELMPCINDFFSPVKCLMAPDSPQKLALVSVDCSDAPAASGSK